MSDIRKWLNASDAEAGPACSNVPVPLTIATDGEFRESYGQGYRHCLTDVRRALKSPAEPTPPAHTQRTTARALVQSWMAEDAQLPPEPTPPAQAVGGRVPSAWSEFGDGHDYSRTGKHDPNNCRSCLRYVLKKVEASELAARTVKAEAALAQMRAERDAAVKDLKTWQDWATFVYNAPMGDDNAARLHIAQVSDSRSERAELAEQQLAAVRTERDKFRRALENHLCEHDMADWVACAHNHCDPSYCDSCEHDKPHDHQILARAERAEQQLATVRGALVKWIGDYEDYDAYDVEAIQRFKEAQRVWLEAALFAKSSIPIPSPESS